MNIDSEVIYFAKLELLCGRKKRTTVYGGGEREETGLCFARLAEETLQKVVIKPRYGQHLLSTQVQKSFASNQSA